MKVITCAFGIFGAGYEAHGFIPEASRPKKAEKTPNAQVILVKFISMFKYKADSSAQNNTPAEKDDVKVETPKKEEPKIQAVKEPTKDISPAGLYEMLEKNLKWSQIIYEQNRKINSKMFWYAFSGWIRILLILAPLALAAWFLPPFLGDVLEKYQEITGDIKGVKKAAGAVTSSSSSIEQMLKLLPLNSAQQEQLKTILK